METALVMPLFIFLILGMLQLGLMYQARVLTKYAAYKAVRVGSIHNAKKAAMEKAALAILLPMAGRRTSPSFFKATPPAEFMKSWLAAKTVNNLGSNFGKQVDVTICNPTGKITDDFDDPSGELGRNANDWQEANKGRLSIQVTFYYQLVIPFVNGLIWHIVEGTAKPELLRTVRMSSDEPLALTKETQSATIHDFSLAAKRNIYILPIRASWSMRMQSNFLSQSSLPSKNMCHIGWDPPGYNH